MYKQRVLIRALCFVPGLGPILIKKILKLYPNLENLWHESFLQTEKKLGKSLASKIHNNIKGINLANLENGTDYITIQDKEYPNMLKEIYDPPIILYYKGNLNALSGKNKLAVVGSRKISAYGKQVIPHLLKTITDADIIIVSGMAVGIDGHAHQVAVNNNKPTIAVLGSGIDDPSIYPSQNLNLSKKIIQAGGIIISEYPPQTRPKAEYFPRRNRIIAGLCQATLVVEAANRSGSLITAYQALEQNREVMAVPANILLTNSFGTNKLLQRGAKPVVSAKDILETYSLPTITHKNTIKNLSPIEQKIINQLSVRPQTVDNLQQSSKINIVQLNATLSTMEIKGLIKSSGGTYYSQ